MKKRLLKIWNSKRDIIIRTLKTAIEAGLVSVSTLGLKDCKTYIITFGSAALTALINALIQLLKKQVPTT